MGNGGDKGLVNPRDRGTRHVTCDNGDRVERCVCKPWSTVDCTTATSQKRPEEAGRLLCGALSRDSSLPTPWLWPLEKWAQAKSRLGACWSVRLVVAALGSGQSLQCLISRGHPRWWAAKGQRGHVPGPGGTLQGGGEQHNEARASAWWPRCVLKNPAFQQSSYTRGSESPLWS